MQKATILSLALGAALLVAVTTASAQTQPATPPPPPAPYGMPITNDQAKKAMAAAEAEAKKNNWPVAIVILDSGGQMVMMQRLDNTQWGSTDIAKEKARSAVALRRPTKALQDAIAQGGSNLRLLSTGFSVLEGGVPIIVDGKIIGSIGVSGVLSTQDAQTAQAGADAVK
jgi:glc operon protein GlcG